MEITKTCTLCGVPQELTDFYPKKMGRFGVESWCKLCRKAHRRQKNKSKSRDTLALEILSKAVAEGLGLPELVSTSLKKAEEIFLGGQK